MREDISVEVVEGVLVCKVENVIHGGCWGLASLESQRREGRERICQMDGML